MSLLLELTFVKPGVFFFFFLNSLLKPVLRKLGDISDIEQILIESMNVTGLFSILERKHAKALIYYLA